jgi:hypothetical protein
MLVASIPIIHTFNHFLAYKSNSINKVSTNIVPTIYLDTALDSKINFENLDKINASIIEPNLKVATNNLK